MIPVIQTPDTAETERRIIHSINYSEDIYAFSVVPGLAAFTTAVPSLLSGAWGWAVDRSTFRHRLKDFRWGVYAAGWVGLGDANGTEIGLAYMKDDGTFVSLGSTVFLTGGKFTLGPFDVFGTVGVPPGEVVPILVLTARKASGANGAIFAGTIWIRFLPPPQ